MGGPGSGRKTEGRTPANLSSHLKSMLHGRTPSGRIHSSTTVKTHKRGMNPHNITPRMRQPRKSAKTTKVKWV